MHVRRSTSLLTARCFGDVIRHHGVHADVRVDGDGEAEHKVCGLLEDAALWGVGGRREMWGACALVEEVGVAQHGPRSTPSRQQVTGMHNIRELKVDDGRTLLEKMASGVAPGAGGQVSTVSTGHMAWPLGKGQGRDTTHLLEHSWRTRVPYAPCGRPCPLRKRVGKESATASTESDTEDSTATFDCV